MGTTNTTACTAPTPITVSTASATGLIGSGSAALITANSITVNLGAASTTGLLAQGDSDITFNGSTIQTSATTTAPSATQTGLRATDTGSTITASNASIIMGPPNGTTTANSLIGALAVSSGSLSFTNSLIRMLGGVSGVSNNGLQASGAGSQITFLGGTISTLSRSSFGAQADNGGLITLGNGAQITTTGAQNTVGPVGSHALVATGTGSHINGSSITLNVSGNIASGGRADSGGTISLVNSQITTSGVGAVVDPSAGLRAVDGGVVSLTGAASAITTTGRFGHGLSVQGLNSTGTISGAAIAVSGISAYGIHVLAGGSATVTQVHIIDNAPIGSFGGWVSDAGSSLHLTNSDVTAGAKGVHLIKAVNGSVITLSNDTLTSGGETSAGVWADNAQVRATGTVVTTTGNAGSVGVLSSNANGILEFDGGSITTSGDAIGSERPIGTGARLGATLTSNGTSIHTLGLNAHAVVSDDLGANVVLTGNNVRTDGTNSFGLYDVVERIDPSGANLGATLVASNVSVETFGLSSHGAFAAQNFFSEEAVLTANNSMIVTHGDAAGGLRATGAGTVIAKGTTVETWGVAAHGMLARDNGSSVSATDKMVTAHGDAANGAVAQYGGTITGNNVTVTASGINAAAVYAIGASGFGSSANFTGGSLTNSSGPTIGAAGVANITLTNTHASGSGQWLRVGVDTDFPPLAAPEPPMTGIPDPDDDTAATPPLTAQPPPAPAPAGLANILVDNSTVEGSAFTASGSVSNLTLVNNSLWNMTGSSNITNLINDPSLIQYAPPTGDPHALASYKTLTVVTYVGEGGGIGLNTYLGDDTSPSDRLVINGGTATGNTVLHVANTTGPGALTAGNGIEVISAINGATTAPGAFALDNVVAAGPYEYLLFHGGVTPGAENDWFLRNESGPIPPEPPVPPVPPIPPIPPTPKPDPFYRPEAALYSKVTLLARQMGLLLLDTFHARKGDQFLHDDEGALWGRLIGAGLNQKFSGPLAPAFNGTIGAAQLGSDLYVSEDRDNIAGPFISFAHAAGTVRGTILDQQHALGGYLPTDAYNIGGYFTHIDKDDNWYLDAVLMGTWFESYPSSLRGIGTHVSGNGITASLEGGYPFVLDEQWTLEPMAQIVFTSMNFDSSSDPYTTLDFIPDDAWFGRIGARLEDNTTLFGDPVTPFAELNFWHGFGGTDTTVYNSTIPIAVPFGNTDIEIASGISTRLADDASIYIRLSYLKSIDGNYQQMIRGQFGVRYVW